MKTTYKKPKKVSVHTKSVFEKELEGKIVEIHIGKDGDICIYPKDKVPMNFGDVGIGYETYFIAKKFVLKAKKKDDEENNKRISFLENSIKDLSRFETDRIKQFKLQYKEAKKKIIEELNKPRYYFIGNVKMQYISSSSFIKGLEQAKKIIEEKL